MYHPTRVHCMYAVYSYSHNGLILIPPVSPLLLICDFCIWKILNRRNLILKLLLNTPTDFRATLQSAIHTAVKTTQA